MLYKNVKPKRYGNKKVCVHYISRRFNTLSLCGHNISDWSTTDMPVTCKNCLKVMAKYKYEKL